MAGLDQIEQVVGAKAVAVTSNASVYGGSALSFLGWLGSQNFVAFAGILIGVAGLVLNWWHKRAIQRIERERLNLERAQFEARART